MTTDPINLAITEILPFSLILGVLLTLPISGTLLWLYRRSVIRTMQEHASQKFVPLLAPESSTSPPQTSQLQFQYFDQPEQFSMSASARTNYSEALKSPWWMAIVYGVAGIGYTIVMTVAYLWSSGIEFLPVRFINIGVVLAWPIVLTSRLIAGTTQRARVFPLVLYFLLFLFASVFAIMFSSSLTVSDILILWAVNNLLPTIALGIVLNRRIRAVGPIVLTFVMVGITGAILLPFIVRNNDPFLFAIVTLAQTFNINFVGIFLCLNLVGFLVLALIGWQALRLLRIRYENQKISDLTILIDAIWLIFMTTHATLLVFEGLAWYFSGWLAFFTIKGISLIGIKWLNNRKSSRSERPNLLLLRVFSLGKRSEKLFDIVSTHWRYIGKIQMIAGPDLATSTIEPHEFLDYLTGKLKTRFIDSYDTLQLNLSTINLRPDHDSRYRVTEFFCYDDTWKLVLLNLVQTSQAVLMDLRGFTKNNAGVAYEINELFNIFPLERIIFIIDETTELKHLQHTVTQSWSQMRSESPNRQKLIGRMQLFNYTGTNNSEVHRLLQSLSISASQE